MMELVRRSLYYGLKVHQIYRQPTQLTALRLTRKYCVLRQISSNPHLAASQQFNSLNLTQTRHLTDKSSESSLGKALAEADISSITPSNIKFVTIDDKGPAALADTINVPEIVGAIIPYSEWYSLQGIFFFYQYPIMYYLDTLINFMPWWAAIIGLSTTIRMLAFPLVLKSHIISIKAANIAPQTQKINVKINQALASGDMHARQLQQAKLKALQVEHGVNALATLKPLLIQTPGYICGFFTLRILADKFKIDSMTTGGALWFSNLTVPDPIFLLPLTISTLTFLTMRYGDGAANTMQRSGPVGKFFTIGAPVAMFLFFWGMEFPSALLLFWATNSVFTLAYSLFFRTSLARRIFDIPARIEHKPSDLPLSNQTFSSQMRSAYDAGKNSKTTMDVRRLDDIAFRRAGVEPLRKTYKTPPTKQS